MDMFRALLVLSLVFSSASSVGAEATSETPPTCPTKPDLSADALRAQASADPRLYGDARVVIGVDRLGRVIAAIDSDRDGKVNEFWLATMSSRLNEPWSEYLDHAAVFSTTGTARIESADRSVGVTIGHIFADIPALTAGTKFRRTLTATTAVEFVKSRTVDGDNAPTIESVVLDNPSTLPAGFERDALGPATAGPNCNCSTMECDAGGCGALSCTIPNSGPWPGCSTSCDPTSKRFACCSHRLMAAGDCRCVQLSAGCLKP